MSKTLGFGDKQLSKEEIDKQYSNHAVMYGHEMCLLAEAEQSVEKIAQSQKSHLDAMIALRKQAQKFQTETVQTPKILETATPAETQA